VLIRYGALDAGLVLQIRSIKKSSSLLGGIPCNLSRNTSLNSCRIRKYLSLGLLSLDTLITGVGNNRYCFLKHFFICKFAIFLVDMGRGMS
jgi:hypothetical protein